MLKETPHTTTNEINFIKRIGRFSPLKTCRQFLLDRYLAGCEKRSDWGDMDKEEVMEFAREELKRLNKKLGIES